MELKEDQKIQLEMFRSFVEKISKGEPIEPIKGKFTGETKKTVDLINLSIENIMGLLDEVTKVSKAGEEGHLDVRADDSKYPGGWGTVLKGMNNTLDAVIGPLNVAAEYVERISRGDIPEPITDNYNGDFNEIKNNLNTCIDSINLLIEDSLMLSKAGVEGKLDTRADATRHHGDFRKIVEGVNDTLDAVIGPLNVAAEYVERIGRGDIPKPITDTYNGDFNEIKNNLNNCIDGLQGLVECNNILHRLSLNDHTKGVEGKHFGIFGSMSDSTNEVRDRLLSVTKLMTEIAVGDTSQLIEFKKVGKRSEQDHLLPAMIRAMESLDLLIDDTKMLSRAAIEGKLDTRADASRHQGEYREIIQGVNDTLDSVVGPLNVAAEYIERISRGDIPELITENYYGDFNEIKNNLNTCIVAVNNLVEDSLMLSNAGVAGQLDIRANASRHEGDFRRIVEGVNDTLDAVIGPLNVAAEYIERIGRGDIPKPITDTYNGDFNEIKNNLNNCIDGLQGLVECNNILHRLSLNDHTKGVEGKHFGIFGSMSDSTNEVRDRLLSVTRLMNEIAVGNTSQLIEFKKIGKRSEQDHLLPAMIQAMESLDLLIEDIRILSRTAVEGKLDTRADVSRHQGEYREIIQGVNDTLDAVIGPLNVAAEYVERISRGNIPERITENYNGDFNEIKNNLNTCIDSINLLIEDSLMLSEAGVAGRLDIRADATRHHGDFRKIVEGVNDTLDAVIGPLNVAAEYVERISRGDIPELITDNYNGDFNEIKNNLNTCIVAVNSLVSEAGMLVDAAVEGRLDTRADASVHQGDFRRIVEGVNTTLDNLVGYIDRMPLPVMAVNTSFDIMYMNEAGSKLLGSTKKELTGKKCFSQFKTGDCQTQNCACARAMERISEVTSQTVARPMGRELEISYTSVPIKSLSGEVIGAFEFVQDQTASIKVSNYLNCEVEKIKYNLEKLSNGDTNIHFEESIPDEYIADAHKNCSIIHEEIKKVCSTINNLVADAGMLSEAAVKGALDTRADASKHPGDFGKIVKGVNNTLDAVIGPLNVAAEYVERISRGDIPEPITDNYNGDFNEIKNNLNTCIDSINLLIEDSLMLSNAGVEGRLDTRADATRHHGDFRKIVEGVNATLDAVIGPLNVAAEYVERIGRGDIPKPITDTYNGDFNEIKNNLNNCIDGLQGLVECNNVLHRLSLNDHTKGVEGKHFGIFGSMSDSTNEVRDRLLSVTKLMNEVAVGDTSQLEEFKKVGKRSEQDHLLPAMIQAMESLDLLIDDTKMLSRAAIEGKLDTRADASKHQGEYREIIQGVNDTLDSVVGPLNVAAEYIERISRGDIPELITENYYGDFNEIKNNLNTCIDGLQGLVECNSVLHRMAVNDHTKSVEGKYIGIYASMSEATNNVRDRLLNVTRQLNNIAVGETSSLEELKKIGKRSEQDIIMPALVEAMENVHLLIEDVEMLSKAAIEGKLDTRADVSKHKGEYRKVVHGVNDTLDAVIGPLNVAAEYVERISRGDVPELINDNYNGDFNEIKNNLNSLIDAENKVSEVAEALSVGNTNVVITPRSPTDRLMLSMAAVIDNNKHDAGNVMKMAEGNLDFEVKIMSEHDIMAKSCIKTRDTLRALVADTGMLSRAAVEGKLDTRADASKHQGEYRKIVEGVNDTLDAVIGPLNVAAEYVERISRGDIPEPITDNYNGDFNEIKNNLNTCIDAVNNLVEDSIMLSRAGIEGRLDTRADASRHEGDFRRVVSGVNDTLDAVIGPLNVAAEYVERISRGDIPEPITDNYNGDFNEIKNNLNTCIVAVNNLVEDAVMLSKAGIEGRLDTRADASRHEGDFRKVVEGVNDTLDAVIGPLNVAAEYVERISRGDIPEPITDNYNGDFNEIKNNLNTCIDAVNNLVEDAVMLSKAGIEGRLDTRADASRHEGDFRKVVEGVNDTLDAVIGPLNEAIRVSNEFSNGNFRARVDESLRVKGDFINFKNVLNNIGTSVSDVIKSAKSVTIQVVESSDEASRGSDEVAKAAEGVAMSTQKSSELTRELLYKIEGINKDIINLSESNEKIAGTSRVILSAADEVVQIGKNAQELGKETNLKMQNVEKIAKESVDGINNLTEQIKQIDSVVKLINDITSQINLLSLNAAIEAARAGEHGRGFAVVAGEVKNLASKARNATDNIEVVVNSVQRDSKKTADAINAANKEIIDGVNSVNKTLDALNTIIKNATQVTKDIGNITEAINSQVEISAKVVMASEEGNMMTREVQGESETLAAIAQETSASIQEVGAAIHEVTNLSSNLKSEIEMYSV